MAKDNTASALEKFFGTTNSGNFSCPFHGEDNHPSFGVNFEEGIFNCFTCGQKGNDSTFALLMYGARTKKEMERLQKAKDLPYLYNKLVTDKAKNNKELVDKFLFSAEVLTDLEVLSYKGGFAMPIYNISGEVWDLRVYDRTKAAKVVSQKGGTTGLIHPVKHLIPQRHQETEIYIVAGEKDMLIARSMGIDAYMVSGGEATLPAFYGDLFDNKIINIVYDNDTAGRVGAGKLATHILNNDKAAEVYIVDISGVCVENKEDTYDFFIKYGKTREDYYNLPRSNASFAAPKKANYGHFIHIQDIQDDAYYNSKVCTFGYCIAASDSAYGVHTKYNVTVRYEKDKEVLWNKEQVVITDQRVIMDMVFANKAELQVVLKEAIMNLVEYPHGATKVKLTFKPEEEIETFYLSAMSVPSHTPLTEEEAQQIKKVSQRNQRVGNLELQILTKSRMTVGHTYKLYAKPLYTKATKSVCTLFEYHPFKDLTGVSSFHFTPEVKNSLNMIRNVVNYDDNKVDLRELLADAESLLGKGFNPLMYIMMMVTYHSMNEIKTRSGKTMPGTIDALFLGSSRVGKSQTADKISRRLSFGKTVSLATASVPGLIGGVSKIGDRDAPKLGELPRQHEKLLIMEELSKAPRDMIRLLTDVRSSKIARVTKIAELSFPANVRMITLSNPYARPGTVGKSLAAYADGVSALCELVENPEDIARYDFIQLISDNNRWRDVHVDQLILDKHYVNVHRWAITRKPEDLEISEEVYDLIDKVAAELNEKFACDGFRLFSSETIQKVLKMSIGLAGMTASYGSSYEKICVLKEHVEFIKLVIDRNYSHELFRLDEYKLKEHGVTHFTAEDLGILRQLTSTDVSVQMRAVVYYLSENQTKTIDDIAIHAGLTPSEVNALVGELSKHNFVEIDRRGVSATAKFRNAIKEIRLEMDEEDEYGIY